MSFFIRYDNELAFLEKNPLKHALFTLQHYTSSWQKNKVVSEENKRLVWKIFINSQLFVILRTKPDNNHYFILPKKSVKRTVRRQPRKTYSLLICSKVQSSLSTFSGPAESCVFLQKKIYIFKALKDLQGTTEE